MTTYTLQLQISPADLNHLRAAQMRIILGRPLTSAASPDVAWASIDPLSSTDIHWDEEYGIYASTTSLQQGATIRKISQTHMPAQRGARYVFNPSATFSGPFPGGGAPDSYTVQNDVPPNQYQLLTFGLTQSLMINHMLLDDAPISATPVRARQTTTLTPGSSVLIWLQANLSSGTFMTRIPGNSTTVRYAGGVTSATLRYDPAPGMFVPV